MSFFDLEMLKGEPTKPKKNFKKFLNDFETNFLKNKQKLQLIWTYENMVKF